MSPAHPERVSHTPGALTVLGVETSCDETAASVVRLGDDGAVEVLSSVVASQIERHAPYGGVVPEVAARAHVEIIDDIIGQAMAEASLSFGALDGVAATAGPGLVGGVMVGLSAGKAIALARGLPLIAVNHLEGHAVSVRLAAHAPYPFLLLLASGGHCQLLAVEGVGACERLGTTIDDAAGEAFDKIASSLGLPYPGGPALERLAAGGRAERFALPRALLGRAGCDFSFSGLKTAAARLAAAEVHSPQDRADLAASAQAAIAAQLADRSRRAMAQYAERRQSGGRLFVVAGGGGGQWRRAGRAGTDGARPGVRLPGAAAEILHRQRRHDRPGGGGAVGGGLPRRSGCAGAPALAAGRRRSPRPPHPHTRPQGRQGVSGASFTTAGVVGAGAWGTALAQLCAWAGLGVTLWTREPALAAAIGETGRNDLYLPGVDLAPTIRATPNLRDLATADLILATTPAQHLRGVLEALRPHVGAGTPAVLCAKGVEQGSLKLMTQVLAEALPQARAAVLSGPSFAADVAQGLPTAVTLACPDRALGEALARALATPTFRPYLTDDLIGAEAGGAVKNVLAIACGVVEGRGLGRSAHAALITRGFVEMTRLGVALGGRAETLAGLCGLGDLVLTCSSPQSRNMSAGLALGRGETLQAALAGKRSVAEGVASAPAVRALARRLGVEMPICEAVASILAGEIGVERAIEELLSRPLKSET